MVSCFCSFQHIVSWRKLMNAGCTHKYIQYAASKPPKRHDLQALFSFTLFGSVFVIVVQGCWCWFVEAIASDSMWQAFLIWPCIDYKTNFNIPIYFSSSIFFSFLFFCFTFPLGIFVSQDPGSLFVTAKRKVQKKWYPQKNGKFKWNSILEDINVGDGYKFWFFFQPMSIENRKKATSVAKYLSHFQQ